MTLVMGGNVQTNNATVNPNAQKTVGWKWMRYKGSRGRKIHWWLREAFKQGAQVSSGVYYYNPVTGRLRAFNLTIEGKVDVIDSLKSILDEY